MVIPGDMPRGIHSPLSASLAILSRPGPQCNFEQWWMDLVSYLRAESVWELCDPDRGDGKKFFQDPANERYKAKALGVIYFAVDGYYQRMVFAAKTPAEALRLLRAEVAPNHAAPGYSDAKQ